MRGGASQGDGCRAVPLNAAESGGARKHIRTLAFKEKDYDPGLRAGDDLPHAAPICPEPLTKHHLSLFPPFSGLSFVLPDYNGIVPNLFRPSFR
jgi:hypothetical protein